MRASASNGQLMMSGYGNVNVWVLYNRLSDLLIEPGKPARHFKEVRAATQAELETILTSMGHVDKSMQPGLIASLMDTGYLAATDKGYAITEQGVAHWSSWNRRI